MAISLDSIEAELHSIKVSDGSGNDLAIDASGFITVKGDGDFNVTATDLDIRDLAFATDSVDVSGSSVTVSATDLDIRDLDSAQDSVEIATAAGQALAIDGSGFITANINGSVAIVADAISTWKSTAQSVTSTASELAATPLASRDKAIIQNLGSQDIYVSDTNAVTTANGIKIPKGSSMELGFESDADIWAITAAGSSDVRIGEFAA